MRVSGKSELSVHNMEYASKESAEYLERWLSERERGLECLLKTAGPHTELKQEIPASGGRGDFGAAKGS